MMFVRIPVHPAEEGLPDRGDYDNAPALPVGSCIMRLDPADGTHPSGRLTNLTRVFAAAGCPDLSFDGRRILFVAKRTPDDRFEVWEMNADGTGLRQLTTEAGPVNAAIYLSAMYTLDLDEPVHQMAFCAAPADGSASNQLRGTAKQAGPPAMSLFTCRLDPAVTGRFQRITFNPHGVSDPYQLSDGRLLFASRLPPGRSAAGAGPGTSLFVVNPDGTDVFVFADAQMPPAWRGMPCETGDGWVVYVESQAGAVYGGGALVAVKRTRSLHTRRLVADTTAGFYHSPSPLPDDNLLVSFRRHQDESYGVYVFDPGSGTRVARIIDTPQWHEVDAHVLRPRPEPAGRSSVVDHRRATGFLYCMNAYVSNTDRGERIAKGEIDRLQVFRAIAAPRNPQSAGEPRRGGRAEGAVAAAGHLALTEESIGEVPVEADGSFFLEVPAQTPLRWRTLAADGTVLQAMQSWVWVMPNESRGCVGCHEDRELSPPNRHTTALRHRPRPVGVAPTDEERSEGRTVR